MNITRIKIDDCDIGMKVAEDVYNDRDVLLVSKDFVINEDILKRIRSMKSTRIKVYKPNLSEKENAAVVSKVHYHHNVDIVKDVIHNLSQGKSLDMNAVTDVTKSITTQFNDTNSILTCINQIKSIDDYTYAHSVNVSLLCGLIGKWLKLPESQIDELTKAGLLHDIGKSFIDENLLRKTGSLTPEEYKEIKKHPVYSYRVLQKESVSKDILSGVLTHHEREDGSGYPLGVKGMHISEYAKILAIADIYAAMTANRAYKTRECPFQVLKTMQEKEFGKIDYRIASIFYLNIANYYIGEYVVLNTGETGVITHINPFNVLRPIVKIDNTFVDLSQEMELEIVDLS